MVLRKGSTSFIYQNIIKELESYSGSMEIIFVDDGSKDDTFQSIKELSEKDQRVKGIKFSRNFGHQSALMAGLKNSKGDLVVTMDSDGQHPPGIISELIKKSHEGFDIVNTERRETEGIGFFKRISSVLFYKLLNRLSEINIHSGYSDFRLMKRNVVNAYLSLNETDRFNRGLVKWLGFNEFILTFTAPKRYAGNSKYSLKKMIQLGVDGITSFSAKPLRMSFGLGAFAIFLGIIYSIYSIITYFQGKAIPGWPSIIITILFVGGFQLLMLGVIGEYIARIFNESKNRPHYIISETCGKK